MGECSRAISMTLCCSEAAAKDLRSRRRTEGTEASVPPEKEKNKFGHRLVVKK